ncbi:MAG: NACHT domain-containing protein [Pseudonocardiaceae bacterium]
MTETVGGGGGGTRFEPLTGMAPVTAARLRSGTLKDLLDVYGGVESGRLIILGGPGSGKTSAAIMLLREALRRRAVVGTVEARARVPVPVLLTLRGWDPNREPLVDWLVKRLERDYDFLMAREYGSNAAAGLIDGNYLAVILDGLDEIPEELRPAALRELDRQATFRLVVVTRSKELADAVSGAHLIGAAALELCPVEPRQAAEYLASCQTDPPAPAWQCVLEQLRADPGGILAQALDTPLMVSLIRDIYGPGDPVDELLDRSRFPSRDTIEDHLLDRVLPIAYAQHPDRPAPPCTVDEARRQLGFLARHMDGARELAWWQIPRWLPAWPRALFNALVVGLVAAFVIGLMDVLIYRLHHGLTYGIVGGLVWALVFGIGSVIGEGYSQQSGWLLWRRDDTRTPLMFGIIGGLIFGFANGLLVGFLYRSVTKGLAIGLVVFLLIVLLVRFVFSFLTRIAEPSAEAANAIDPLALWRRERQLGLKAGLVFGLTAVFAGGLECGIGYEFLVKAGIIVSLVAVPVAIIGNALLIGLGVALASSATWTATLANAQLQRHGKTSVRLLDFLEDARARGVLRCVGPMYQFRHARLQDRLAEVCEIPQPPRAVGSPQPHGLFKIINSGLVSRFDSPTLIAESEL